MTQQERRLFLIHALLAEGPDLPAAQVPRDEGGQKRLLRSLMNIRPPKPASAEFLRVQDAYLRQAAVEKGITDCSDLAPLEPGIFLWQGDCTALRCGAVVNAANSGMTGCYAPCHGCIDNAIHTFAGVQLRLACAELMALQGHGEPPGRAKITPAFNLPCGYVIHTVGPAVSGRPTPEDCELLASCYRSCLALAQEHGIGSVAFCCLSTGVFCFPNELAAETAVRTVREHKGNTKVIFNVFKDIDYRIYRGLLG